MFIVLYRLGELRFTSLISFTLRNNTIGFNELVRVDLHLPIFQFLFAQL